MSEPDWYTETFGNCSHGGIKPYCAQCAGDELEKQHRAERERKRRVKREREVGELRATVARQSDALDDSYSHVRSLKRRLRGQQ